MIPVRPKTPRGFPGYTNYDELTKFISELLHYINLNSSQQENDHAGKLIDVCLNELRRRNTVELNETLKKNSLVTSKHNKIMIWLTITITLLTAILTYKTLIQ